GFAPYTNYSATHVDASTNVTATCTAGTPYTMAVSAGANYNAAGGMGGGWRNLANGASYLGYGIYQDAAYTTFWGSGVAGQGSLGAVKSATGTGVAANHMVYGRIPSGQAAVLGGYTDAVVATLTY
ncbi:MAG: spore coat U domain-containing protein, partial [Gallionella sp.]|nr:spore coat U domain-containing protein [Gallionella sp.]